MRALAEMGRVGDALRQFAECTSALSAKFDAPPSRATFELKGEIERGAIVPSREGATRAASSSADVTRRLVGAASSRQIHGRGDALLSTRRFVEGARGVLLVIGEAGLGKTRLVGECARWAAGAGAVVLAGLGLDQDSGVPYAPFADAWAHHRRTTHASVEHDPFLSFSPSGGSAQEDRLRLFHAVERSVETFGGQAPVCIVIENLHQADPVEPASLPSPRARDAAQPLLLVGTLREEEAQVGRPLHTLLASLAPRAPRDADRARRLDLEATTQLVAELCAASSPGVAAAVYALAEGNPFHTEEVVQAMLEEATTRPSMSGEPPRHRPSPLAPPRSRRRASPRRRRDRGPPLSVRDRAPRVRPRAGARARRARARRRGTACRGRRGRVPLPPCAHAAGAPRLGHQRGKAYLHGAVADALESIADVQREDRAELLAFHHEAAGQIARALPYLLAAGERARRRALASARPSPSSAKRWRMMDQMGRADGDQRFSVLRMLGGMRMALSDLDGAVRDLDAAASLATAEFRPSATRDRAGQTGRGAGAHPGRPTRRGRQAARRRRGGALGQHERSGAACGALPVRAAPLARRELRGGQGARVPVVDRG